MFEVGFIELVDFVPLRAGVFLAAACFAALFVGRAFPAAAAFDVPVAAFLAGDLLVPGLAGAPLGALARLETRPEAAGGVAGSVATADGTGCVVLDPNAAWTVANASSSESWRVSTVTFMPCSWAGRMEILDRNVRPELDVAASTLALLDKSDRHFEPNQPLVRSVDASAPTRSATGSCRRARPSSDPRRANRWRHHEQPAGRAHAPCSSDWLMNASHDG